MGRRNHDRYTADDWREAGPTVGAILANRWLVYTRCNPRALSFPRKRGRIARERGPGRQWPTDTAVGKGADLQPVRKRELGWDCAADPSALYEAVGGTRRPGVTE